MKTTIEIYNVNLLMKFMGMNEIEIINEVTHYNLK